MYLPNCKHYKPNNIFYRFLDEIEITESKTEYLRSEEEYKVSLKIKEVMSEMKGIYKCQVINEHGETTCEGRLTVNCEYFHFI